MSEIEGLMTETAPKQIVGLSPSVQKLLDLRTKTDVRIKMPSRMREDIKLRSYQCIGAVHLFAMPWFFLADQTGLGKTAQAITAFAHQLDLNPKMKLLVVTTNSAMFQWGSEFKKFTKDIQCRVVSFEDHKGFNSMKDKRSLTYEKWATLASENVLIMNYAILWRDWDLLEGLIKRENITFMVIYDESNAFKNPSTKLFGAVYKCARKAQRVILMSATPIRNRLTEFYAQFKVMRPMLFQNQERFESMFVKKLKLRAKGGRVFHKITGYKNMETFKAMILPYYLGRKKGEVAQDLPKIILKDVLIDMEKDQAHVYEQVKMGGLKIPGGDFKALTPLTKLIYAQLISDSTNLLSPPQDTVSSKEIELLRLLEEELADEKVVIYTKFRRGVIRLEGLLRAKGIDSRVIHGEIPALQREQFKKDFQESDVNVMIINDAGGEAINLQAAGYLIFYNLPWSLGTYIQLVGRVHRIGSIHQSIVLISMVNRGTIDEYTLEILQKKLDVMEAAFGSQGEFIQRQDDNITDDLAKKMGFKVEKLFEIVQESPKDSVKTDSDWDALVN